MATARVPFDRDAEDDYEAPLIPKVDAPKPYAVVNRALDAAIEKVRKLTNKLKLLKLDKVALVEVCDDQRKQINALKRQLRVYRREAVSSD